MKIQFKYIAMVACVGTLFSCNDFLDEQPTTSISPEVYLTDESHLEAYANGLYTNILPSHGNWSYGTFGEDRHTDNQAATTYDNRFVPGQWRTAQTESGSGSNWYFKNIYSCNYFLQNVLPKYDANSIKGSTNNIRHYIGEIYFMRAHEYFKRYQMFGDMPIIKEPLSDDLQILIENSKRSPRNEVARFILSDLDTAIELMETTPDSRRTRISKEAALLLKSRVALYEGTWLKYFKGTAFVPNGEGWPGASKAYNSGYQYPSGSIDNEISYFLTQSMDAAEKVVGMFDLVQNTNKVQQSQTDAVNPYMDMFGDENLTGYSEVLLWRQYDITLSTHNVVVAAQNGNNGVGVTRGLVDGFLMANGLPIYAAGSGYQGDDNIANVRINRDSRLSLFLKEPGQKNILFEGVGSHAVFEEPVPALLEGSDEKIYNTGYSLRKGNSYYQKHCQNGGGFTGSITFRGSEAYLNYIEACYELNGSLNNVASNYWKALRNRAHVDSDFNKTIAATIMTEEAKNDWGAYSAGKLIDATLYNIRRERRSELMAEGLRYMDLRRWRAMDQMITTPYHIEGFKIWGEMQEWYKNNDGTSKLIYGLDNSVSNVSDPARGQYLRPYEKVAGSLVLNGYKWAMAHYLTPICIQHMLITSSNSNVSDSPIYQNPGWPTTANVGAEY